MVFGEGEVLEYGVVVLLEGLTSSCMFLWGLLLFVFQELVLFIRRCSKVNMFII